MSVEARFPGADALFTLLLIGILGIGLPGTAHGHDTLHAENEDPLILLVSWSTAPGDLSGLTIESRHRIDAQLERLTLPATIDLPATLRWLRQQPGVRLAEADQPAHAQAVYGPQDPDRDRQWHLDALQLPRIWSHSPTDCDGPLIAMIDSGIDLNHPELQDALWVNPGEIPDNGIDDDGNGCIDDIHGCDFQNSLAANRGKPKDGQPEDAYGHGTHIAGLIAAQWNDQGGAGVCRRARLMAVRFLDRNGSGSLADAAAAIRYAMDQGADIITHAWAASTESEVLADMFAATDAAGILSIAAAGNSGRNNDLRDTWPANYRQRFDTLLSIANLTPEDTLHASSHYGLNTVDLAAPGTRIYSTRPLNRGGYGEETGTSMAVPLVAAAAALVRQQDPTLDAHQLKGRLLSEARRIDALTGRLIVPGAVDAASAQEQSLPKPVQFRARLDAPGQLHVHGAWLKDIATATLNDTALSVRHADDRQVTLAVPAAARNGWLHLSSGQQTSNPLWLETGLAAPDKVRLSRVSQGLQLVWEVAESAEQVHIERALNGGAFQALVSLPAHTDTWLDRETSAGDSVQYRLRASYPYTAPDGQATTQFSATTEASRGELYWQTRSLLGGQADQAMDVQLLASIHDAQFRLIEGELPDGLTLTPQGHLSGTPKTPGDYPLVLLAESGEQAVRLETTLSVESDRRALTLGGGDVLDIHESQGALRGGQRYLTIPHDPASERIELYLSGTHTLQLTLHPRAPLSLIGMDWQVQADTTERWQDIRESGGVLQARYAEVIVRDGETPDLDEREGHVRLQVRIHTTSPAQLQASARRSGHCFVASALYTDPQAPQLVQLRRFRDEVLRNTPLGDRLIERYYAHSPQWVARLRTTPQAAPLLRHALDELIPWLAPLSGAP